MLPQSSYKFPVDQLHNSDVLLDLLGTHWSSVYRGRDLAATLQAGIGLLEEQNRQNWQEARDCAVRAKTPIWHTEHWRVVTIRESAMGRRALRYGDGATYGGGYVYGGNLESNRYLVPLPAGVVHVPLITNRITEPSLVLVHGADYSIDQTNGYLELLADPFDNPALAIRPVFSGDTVIDHELDLLFYYAREDRRYLDQHWGYVLDLSLPSSEAYRQLLNTVLDALVEGSSLQHLHQLIEAVTGVPLAAGSETVERIEKFGGWLHIVTDQRTYRYVDTADALVTVGQQVVAGQSLVDSVQWYEFNRGLAPAGLPALTMGTEHLAGVGFIEGLTFNNTTVPLKAEVVGGQTKVSFELGGFPTDVSLFWDQVHARGLADGQTLAERMTGLANPTPADLPLTANPLEFLLKNLLRFNALAVKIRVQDAGQGLGLEQARILRKILPPWTACFLLYELEAPVESVPMDGPGDATKPGYADSIDKFTAGEPMVEAIDPATYVAEEASIYYIQESCS